MMVAVSNAVSNAVSKHFLLCLVVFFMSILFACNSVSASPKLSNTAANDICDAAANAFIFGLTGKCLNRPEEKSLWILNVVIEGAIQKGTLRHPKHADLLKSLVKEAVHRGYTDTDVMCGQYDVYKKKYKKQCLDRLR